MSVLHYVLGYEQDGNQLVFEKPIRETVISDLKRIITAYEDDPDLLDVYELDAAQIDGIEQIIGERIPVEGVSLFLQAFSEPLPPRS